MIISDDYDEDKAVSVSSKMGHNESMIALLSGNPDSVQDSIRDSVAYTIVYRTVYMIVYKIVYMIVCRSFLSAFETINLH